MATRNGRRRAIVLARSVGAVLAMCVAVAAAAEPGELVRAAVVVADDEDRALLARIRGQTSDLDVVVLEHRPAPAAQAAEPGAGGRSELGPSARGALARARVLAEQLSVRLVVWFVRSESAWTVYLAEPAAGRLLVREVPRSVGANAVRASADREAVALIVRSSLRAIALGEVVGDVEPALQPEPEPEPEPAPSNEAEPSIEAEPANEIGVRLHAGAEVGLSVDGSVPAWPGGRLFFGATRGAWRVDVGGRASPFFELAGDERATIDAARFEIDAAIGWAPSGPGSRMWVEVAGRGVWLYRRTRAVAADLSATPDAAIATGAVGPGVRYRVAAGAWALELAAGADFFLAPPEFGVDNGSGFESLTRLWSVSPRVGIAALFEF